MKNFFVLLLILTFGRLAVAGVDISGEYRFREWSGLNGSAEVNDERTTDSRFILGASFREGDSLMAHLSFFAGSVESLLITNEVYGVWNFADAFEFKFGTFSVDWANGSVFAANSWQDNPMTFDGASLVYDAGMVKVTYAEFDQSDSPGSKQQAVSVDFMSLPRITKTVHLFYVKVEENDLSKYGAVVTGNLNRLNYGLTYASDKKGDDSATMINAKIGINIRDMGQFVVTYHKDEMGYDALYYDKHANAGLMDVHSWGSASLDDDLNGLTYYTVGYVHSLNDTSAAGVLYHDFSATESGDKLGTEIDVYASHKYNDVLTATIRYGKYTPDSSDAWDQWMLGMNLNF